jgi:hypothetical protein
MKSEWNVYMNKRIDNEVLLSFESTFRFVWYW